VKAVSDSSPLHYLILIDAVSVLPALFGRISAPNAVVQELQHPDAPAEVRATLAGPPDWLSVEEAASVVDFERAETIGPGEREAIALAAAGRPDELLLIDEARGREVAARLGIRFIGTLGVLDLAAARGLLDLPAAIERLIQTNFYVTPNLLKSLLDADRERKSSVQP